MLHSVDDLMPIGEFSDRSGLSAKRLRTYAAEGLLAPAAVDPGSGYRYYSQVQLADARMIDALREAGVPLAEIRAFRLRPSQDQLNAWASQLEVDAGRRQGALARARNLLARGDYPLSAMTKSEAKEGLVLTLRTAGRTDIGRVREDNEDVIVTSDQLALVADGMGGHPGGEIAAAVVAGMVSAAFTGRSVDELEAAIRAANWSIRERAVSEAGMKGMGTTVCAAGLLTTGYLALVNVGDSRAYLFRQRSLSHLTRDHSLTAELIERGELREKEAAQHPHYGILTRALGVGSDVEIDRSTLAVKQRDRLLLCSDGLFNELTDEEIEHALAEDEDVTAIVDKLIDGAIANGGRDNVSAVVAEVAACGSRPRDKRVSAGL